MRLLKTRGHQMNIHLFYIFNKSKQLSLLPHNTVVFMCVAMLLMSASALRGQRHHIWGCRQVETQVLVLTVKRGFPVRAHALFTTEPLLQRRPPLRS